MPRAPPVVCPSPKLSRYPVAILPGQFSDAVRQYSSQELNKLPLRTVLDASSLETAREPTVCLAIHTHAHTYSTVVRWVCGVASIDKLMAD